MSPHNLGYLSAVSLFVVGAFLGSFRVTALCDVFDGWPGLKDGLRWSGDVELSVCVYIYIYIYFYIYIYIYTIACT